MPSRSGSRPRRRIPTLYKVVLLNDDYTTMEFVMHVLETLFQKSSAEAYRIMMQVHLNGSGIAGVYPWEVAETKVDAVTRWRAPPVTRCKRRSKKRELGKLTMKIMKNMKIMGISVKVE